MASFIRELWAPFEIDGPVAGAPVIEVRRKGESWLLRSFDGQGQEVPSPWSLVLALRSEMDRFTLTNVPDAVDLHAAAAQIEDKTVLFPGAPGAGKTTLVLAGLHSGWKLVADDMTLLNLSDRTITVLPRPIGLRAKAELDPERWSPPDWVPVSRSATLVPASVFELARGPELQVDGIVFPRFAAGAPTVLGALSPADALAKLTSHVRPMVPRVMSSLSAMCMSAPAYALEYGDPEEGAGRVTETLAAASRYIDGS